MKTLNESGIGRLVVMVVFALFFTQCEKTGLSNTADMTVDERGGKPGNVSLCDCLAATFPIEDLSATETAALLFMREEEKLARDVYLYLNTKWNAQVFANISTSEQRHMDAVLCLIDKYGLTDPVGNNGNGVFANTTLQQLYNTLIAQGETGLAEAYTAGATIEDLDIHDLMEIEADPEVDNADIRAVFDNLMRGSRNHLRAFTRNLTQLGDSYTPQYITQETYDAILNADWETGSGPCGMCNGPNGGGPNGGSGWGPGNGGPNGPGNGTGICPWGNDSPNPAPQFDGKRKRG